MAHEVKTTSGSIPVPLTSVSDTTQFIGAASESAAAPSRGPFSIVWTYISAKVAALYYTQTQVDSLLSGKAATSHTHSASQISDSTSAGRALLTAADAAGQKAALSLVKGDVGLGNVDNTADADKPISTATQTALDGKAATSHTHSASQISDSTSAGRALLTAADAAAQKTALSLVKGDVGLGNVDNTSDADKPISTATQTALDGKAATSHTHSASQISDSTSAGRALLTAADAAGQKAALSLVKGDVGLGNVDNTSDANKPISTATQTALDGKAATSHTHGTAGIDDDAVTYAKMQNVSTTSRVLGRKTAGAGDVEELTFSELLDFVGSAAQGDILYRGSSGWARLGAGTSGQYLKTQGAGANPAWDTPAGGGGSSNYATSPPLMSTAFGALASGTMRGTILGAGATSSVAATANRLYLMKFHPEKARTLTGIGIKVTTAGAAGTLARLGIYEMSEDGLPTTLLLDAGTVATDSTGYKEITISQAVSQRPYYLAVVFDGTPTITQTNITIGVLGADLNTSGTSQAIGHIFRSFTFATLPTDETGSAGGYSKGATGTAPAIGWI